MRLRWWHAVRLASVLLYAVFHMPSRPGKRKAPPSSGHGRALMNRGDDVGAGHEPVLFGPPTFDLNGAASNSEGGSGSADRQSPVSPDIDSIGGSLTTPDDPSLHGLVLLDGSMVVPSAEDPVGLVNFLVAIPNSQFHSETYKKQGTSHFHVVAYTGSVYVIAWVKEPSVYYPITPSILTACVSVRVHTRTASSTL